MPCVIRKYQKEGPTIQPVIRIGQEEYNAICNIAQDTNRSILNVATQLLRYALENCEVEE